MRTLFRRRPVAFSRAATVERACIDRPRIRNRSTITATTITIIIRHPELRTRTTHRQRSACNARNRSVTRTMASTASCRRPAACRACTAKRPACRRTANSRRDTPPLPSCSQRSRWTVCRWCLRVVRRPDGVRRPVARSDRVAGNRLAFEFHISHIKTSHIYIYVCARGKSLGFQSFLCTGWMISFRTVV